MIKIPYGNDYQYFRGGKNVTVLRPQHFDSGLGNESDIVEEALKNPINSGRLSDMAVGKRKITLITSDHTRPVPSRITLPLILSEIRYKNPNAEVTILIATGLHRATTEDELRLKFGDEIVDNEKIIIHDARNEADLAYFGRLPSGGELWLNKLIDEADLVVAEGFVEPHFFAGFSGGRKAILPGCAGEKTVLWNHNANFISSTQSRTGKIDDNPIHKDMLFAAKAAKLAFILNVLLDQNKHIIAAFSGDMEEAHKKGCELSRRLCEVRAVESDIVITSNGGYPLDQNIYQCVKGMTAAEACVKKGGVIIMCAEISDGTGGESFYHWFADRKSSDEVMRDIMEIPPSETVSDQWEAQILARIMQKATCIFVADEDKREILEAMHLTWAPSVDKAVEIAIGLVGQEGAITVIPDGVGVIVV